jgi:hypothetical protein
MRYYNVYSRKSFIDDNGEPGLAWYKCGHVKVTPNKAKYLTLYGQPETWFQIFSDEDQPKEIE